MAEPHRRRRLQMHLSTAIVMMIAAGGLIYLSVRSYNHIIFLGWPKEFGIWSDEPFKDTGNRVTIEFWSAFIDLAVALAILCGVWFVSEWWIRRRAKN